MKVVKILAVLIGFVIIAGVAGGLYVNYALPDTGPAPIVKIQVTKDRIERGKYLANHVTVCMDCHSTRDWTLFSGPMVEGTQGVGGELFDENMGFPGKIYASNLTPHALIDWSDGELLQAVTMGQSKDGRALFPIMAYPRFGKMDQEDIYSIIAYIRSLQPIVSDVPKTQLDFPVNLINKTFPGKADFQAMPDRSDTARYGAYLVNAAGCVECHSKTDKGQVIKGTEFGGGMEFKFPTGTVRSPNITMHKTNGLGKWTKEAFISRFKMYVDSSYKAEKVGITVNNTPMPWTMYGGMDTADLGAIFEYLNSLEPSANKVVVRSFN